MFSDNLGFGHVFPGDFSICYVLLVNRVGLVSYCVLCGKYSHTGVSDLVTLVVNILYLTSLSVYSERASVSLFNVLRSSFDTSVDMSISSMYSVVSYYNERLFI